MLSSRASDKNKWEDSFEVIILSSLNIPTVEHNSDNYQGQGLCYREGGANFVLGVGGGGGGGLEASAGDDNL